MRVSDDQKYVWGRRLNACINTRKFKGLDYHRQRSKKWFTWHVISIIAENKPHAHQKNFLHTMTIAALLIKILIFFRPLSSVHLFQSNQRFEFVDRHVSEKLNLIRKTCAASIMQRFLFPVSTVSARNAWHNDPPFCVLNAKKNALQIMGLAANASETNKNNRKSRAEKL